MYIVTIWYYIRIFNAIILDHNFLIFSVLSDASLKYSI